MSSYRLGQSSSIARAKLPRYKSVRGCLSRGLSPRLPLAESPLAFNERATLKRLTACLRRFRAINQPARRSCCYACTYGAVRFCWETTNNARVRQLKELPPPSLLTSVHSCNAVSYASSFSFSRDASVPLP